MNICDVLVCLELKNSHLWRGIRIAISSSLYIIINCPYIFSRYLSYFVYIFNTFIYNLDSYYTSWAKMGQQKLQYFLPFSPSCMYWRCVCPIRSACAPFSRTFKFWSIFLVCQQFPYTTQVTLSANTDSFHRLKSHIVRCIYEVVWTAFPLNKP